GAGIYAGRLAALRQPSVAHIALAHHAAFRVVLRHAVLAVPGAVLAADAGVGAVLDDAGKCIFRVGIDRASLQTGRFQAVVAAHGEVKSLSERVGPAFDFTNTPPVHVSRIVILLIACHLTAVATDALRHVEVEPVLLTRCKWL